MSRQRDASAGPCAGLRILDFTTVVSGPWCTQALADLGADVIKVETALGDLSRITGGADRAGLSPYFSQLNRGKRSVVIDMKSEEGQALAARLAEGCDVLVENFRPGVAERLGVGCAALRERNPRLVYVAISGFGPEGPYAALPAYDHVIQGLVGVMPAQGSADAPRLSRNVAADKVAAQTATSAVLAALLARERTGEGQRVDVPMLDAYAAFLLPEEMAAHTFVDAPAGATSSADSLFRTWQTADGFVVGFPIQDDQFAGLCRVLGRDDLAGDERFAGMAQRFAHLDALADALAPALRAQRTADFIERARKEGAPFAPVNTVDDFIADPQVAHSAIVREAVDASAGAMRLLAPPVRFDATPIDISRLPPRLGEHTEEVLGELGLSEGEVAALKQRGIVR